MKGEPRQPESEESDEDETAYLLSSPANARRLTAAVQELNAGRGIEIPGGITALEHYARLSADWDYEGWLRRHQAEKEAEN